LFFSVKYTSKGHTKFGYLQHWKTSPHQTKNTI